MTRLNGIIIIVIIGACVPDRATNVEEESTENSTTNATNDHRSQNENSTNATNSANSSTNTTDNTCPTERPAYGSPCDHPAHDRCDYFLRESDCWPGVSDYDIYDHCECTDGGWDCSADHEDCRCPLVRPEDGSSCAARFESTCDYFVRGSYCMPGVPDYDIYDHCDCTDGRWGCHQDLEDCFPSPPPAPDAGTDA